MRKLSAWGAIALLLSSPLPAAAASSEETVLAVALNGEQVSIGSVMLHESDDTYALAVEDAQLWRLLLPTQIREQYKGNSYIPLRALPAISVHFNEQLQRLELRIPAKYFLTTKIDEMQPSNIPAPERGKGAFLNYDLHGQTISGTPALVNGVFDADTTLGEGVLDTSYVGNVGQNLTSLRRIASSWQEDDLARQTTLRLGDASSNSGALIVGQPFFGVQLLRNFFATPGMTLNPRPSVAGSTDTPSTADVYVDGRLVVRQDLPSGPFQIENIPTSGDAGNVQVIVKNAAGQEQVISTPYYGPATMLKSGLTTFSWGAGLESRLNSSGSQQYGGPITEFFDQHGFSDRFTGELDGTLARDGHALSGGGVWLVPRVGTLDLALSSASGTGIGGGRFDYEYLSHGLRFGFGASTLQQNTTLILTPGISTPSSITRQEQAHLSYPTSTHSSLSLTLSDQTQNTTQNGILTNSPSRTLQGGYSTALGKTQLNCLLFRTSGSVATTAFTVSAMIPLDFRHRAIVTTGAQSGQSGQNQSNIMLTADPVLTGDHHELGYSATLGPNEAVLQLTDWTKSMDLQGGFSSINGIDESQLDARGSLSLLDHHLFASRSILQSYGLAEVPDHPNVRVYSDGQYVGATDAHGEVLLPNLQAYQNNRISLETKDFPVTANLEASTLDAVPYYRSPVIVRFPVREDGGVVVHLKLPNGEYLPAGATLSEGAFSWPVLDQGSAYLDGVHPGSLTLAAEAGETSCRATIIIPKNVTEIPDIGTATCR